MVIATPVIGAGVEGISFGVLGLNHAFPADGEVLAGVGISGMVNVRYRVEVCGYSRTSDLAGAIWFTITGGDTQVDRSSSEGRELRSSSGEGVVGKVLGAPAIAILSEREGARHGTGIYAFWAASP